MHFIIITTISYSMNRMVVLMKQSFIGKMDGGNSDGKERFRMAVVVYSQFWMVLNIF